MQHEGHHGMQPWAVRPDYKAYQSKYGPKYVVNGLRYRKIDATGRRRNEG